MIDSRFRLQRTSHKRALHLCKAMLTVCTPDLKVQISSGQSGFSEILIYVVFNFLESFINWFADCLHCDQEGPFPTKKTCLVSMIWRHSQQTLRVDQTCYWCCRLWCQLLSTTASCSSWQLQVYWISTARFLSFRPRHSVDCNTRSATTLKLHVIHNVYDDAS